ncbi:MAG TPA: sigma-54 dependent transcriptional regulator [Thermodesulfobacteriota bacterium]|nr:sigma-54 dependent transcriptional regulator [Thermodesulfobacteriota bacterium]
MKVLGAFLFMPYMMLIFTADYMPMKILLADDDKNLRKVLKVELSGEGYTVLEAEYGSRVLDLLENHNFDILLLDLNLPDIDGIEILKKIKCSEVPVEVIILTAYGSISTAVDAMKLGAYDYLTKPFQFEELAAVVEKAYEKKKLLSENFSLKTQITKRSEDHTIITRSPLLLKVLENARNFALSDFPIAILGESGVGKELLAEVVHKNSKRSKCPFIRINCGAIPENTIESEFFGHEKGSFTGAHMRKPGLIEIANRGILFLDEIGELPYNLQTRLLRVLDSGTFFRVGGTKEVEVDVRFISATNRNLKSAVENGTFRQDLYYRLTTLTLHVPPLRERREDIPILVHHILHTHPNFRNKRLTDDTLRVLAEYRWPGNVRELQNVIYRTLLLSERDLITANDLPDDLQISERNSSKRLKDLEKEHILTVLREVHGRRGEAARVLGVDPKTLYRKLSTFRVGAVKE